MRFCLFKKSLLTFLQLLQNSDTPLSIDHHYQIQCLHYCSWCQSAVNHICSTLNTAVSLCEVILNLFLVKCQKNQRRIFWHYIRLMVKLTLYPLLSYQQCSLPCHAYSIYLLQNNNVDKNLSRTVWSSF